MLDTHLAPHATCRRLRAGPAADHIDDFADWLHRRGYRPKVLRNKLRSFAAWTDWLRLNGMTGTDFIDGVRACESYIGMRPRARYQRGPNKESLTVARLFIRFLQERNVFRNHRLRRLLQTCGRCLGSFGHGCASTAG